MQKRMKTLTGMHVLTKDFAFQKIRYVFKKKKVIHFVKPITIGKIKQSTNQLSPLMHGQIHLIKFVESDIFDIVYSKI